MDNTKDTQVNTETNQSLTKSQKEFNPIDFFAKDQGFVFVYKKTEKLATAMYMVTNLFSDSEPMKWTLRSKVSQLLSFIIGFKDILASREDEFSHDVKTKVLEIVSLLEVASRSGLVSPMNFSVLKTEFIHMVNFLSDFRKATSYNRGDLKENFFDTTTSTRQYSTATARPQTMEPKGQKPVFDAPKPIQQPNNRQNIIMSLLRKKKEITIHDVAEVISDCSEKTIQRELITLIAMGTVQKTGERRWSKYSLVSPEDTTI